MLFFQKKCPVILCFIIGLLSLSPITTINSTGDLSTALSLLKVKLLSLASELGGEKNEEKNNYLKNLPKKIISSIKPKTEDPDELVTYNDIKYWDQEKITTLLNFYVKNMKDNENLDIKNLKKSKNNENYPIKKIESLKQKTSLCGYFAAFNGTELYKAAIKNDGDASTVNLKRKADKEFTEQEKQQYSKIYKKLNEPYIEYNKAQPTEFDAWLIKKMTYIKNKDFSSYENVDRLLSFKKTEILSDNFLDQAEIFILALDSILNKDAPSLLKYIMYGYFPFVRSYKLNNQSKIDISIKWAIEFHRTCKPILILFIWNLDAIACLITKKGLFYADSHGNENEPLKQSELKKILSSLFEYFVKDDDIDTKTNEFKLKLKNFSSLKEGEKEDLRRDFLNEIIAVKQSDLKEFKKKYPELFETEKK